MRLVIVTRTAQPALVEPGQLIEIRADNLRHSPEETAFLLEKEVALKVSAKDITTLESRTEG